ncbi:MAG: hypothetical protein LBU89_03295 [Fibromonadaceae bacterium]|jgi:hypothetical protein|nr:hypothetical protein [Fibromonadaceae bacterium]
MADKFDLEKAIAAVRSGKPGARKQNIVNKLYAYAFENENKELFRFLEAREESLKPKDNKIEITINRVSNGEKD